MCSDFYSNPGFEACPAKKLLYLDVVPDVRLRLLLSRAQVGWRNSRCCLAPAPALLFLLFLRFNEPASGGTFRFKTARTARTARSTGRQCGGPRGAGSTEPSSQVAGLSTFRFMNKRARPRVNGKSRAAHAGPIRYYGAHDRLYVAGLRTRRLTRVPGLAPAPANWSW